MEPIFEKRCAVVSNREISFSISLKMLWSTFSARSNSNQANKEDKGVPN